MIAMSNKTFHSLYYTGFIFPNLIRQCSRPPTIKSRTVFIADIYLVQTRGKPCRSYWFVTLKGKNEDPQDSSKDKKSDSEIFRFRSKGTRRGDLVEEKNTKRVLNVWSSETGFLVGIVFVFILFLFYLYEYLKEYYFPH